MASNSPFSQSQKHKMTDFSQGDPEASICVPNSSDEENEIQTDYLKEGKKLAGSTDESEPEESDDSDSWNANEENVPLKSSPSNHVSFKTYSKQSVADLRKESRSLLLIKSPSVVPISAGLNQTMSDVNKTATIFELCWDDRQRVGQLIGELASSQEKLNKLEAHLSTSENQETKYKHKNSDLMKKVDALGEKTRRLENEKAQMKEKHLDSLNLLQNKITTISDQFEASAKEIQRLTTEKQRLQIETAAIRAKTSTLDAKLQAAEEINLRTKVLLETAVTREKTFQSQIKELSANFNQKTNEEQIRKKVVKDLENRLKSTEKQLEEIKIEAQKSKTSPRPQCLSPATVFTEIYKPPEDQQPIISPIVNTISSRNNNVQSTEQKEDAILQDLFFRF